MMWGRKVGMVLCGGRTLVTRCRKRSPVGSDGRLLSRSSWSPQSQTVTCVGKGGAPAAVSGPPGCGSWWCRRGAPGRPRPQSLVASRARPWAGCTQRAPPRRWPQGWNEGRCRGGRYAAHPRTWRAPLQTGVRRPAWGRRWCPRGTHWDSSGCAPHPRLDTRGRRYYRSDWGRRCCRSGTLHPTSPSLLTWGGHMISSGFPSQVSCLSC